MGKLVERLNRIGKSGAAPIGFGRVAGAPEPALGIVAALNGNDKGLAKKAVEQGALAVVLHNGDKGAAKDAGLDVPCGANLSGNCAAWDFIIAGAGNVEIVLRLPDEPSDDLLRTLEALPIDAVVLTAPPSLTAERLGQLYRVTRSTQKHVLAAAGADISKAALIALRDAGVTGLLVNVAKDSVEGIGSLKKTIASLPPKKAKTPSRRPAATLPSVRAAEPAAPTPDDDGDDDD
jgi:hypothetical protein